jgi:predicted dehydrogenase
MKFGLIGAGGIAQVMHLPYLAEIPDIELNAIADPGANVVETLGDRYNIPHRYEDNRDMIDELGDELDSVVVTTPMHTHADVAVAALEAGLHVFVEKPVAVTPEDAERVVAAAEENDAICMIGYMKRYDPGFLRFEREVEKTTEVDLVTNVVIPPDVGAVLDENYDLLRADLDDAFLEASGRERQAQLAEAVGTDDETLTRAYGYHLESICHDVNVLRALFGEVERIDHVDVFNGWRYATAQLRYEDDRRCTLQSGATDRKWYDERIRVDAPDRSLSIAFSNAFLRNNAADVRVKVGTDEVEETRYVPSYEEAFKLELVHFVECIDSGADPRTPPAEAKKDVELIADLIRQFHGAELVRPR